MTNQEIIIYIDNLLKKNLNYCDLIIELKKFNKEYKKTNFYKSTHLSLFKLIKDYQANQLYNLDNIFAQIQTKIDSLNLDNIINLLNQLQSSLAKSVEDDTKAFNSVIDFAALFNEDRGE